LNLPGTGFPGSQFVSREDLGVTKSKEAMKKLLKALLRKAGIWYAKRQYMPYGIDWAWDISRLNSYDREINVIDAGANIGQTVLILKEAFPNGSIDAFEPAKGTFEQLRNNVGHMHGVRCHCVALSDKLGRGQMVVGENFQLSHLSPDTNESVDGPIEFVDVTTIDQFCEENQLRHIDILKIDTEGGDLNVLKGAKRVFVERRVDFVLVEVGFAIDDHTHSYYPEIFEFLKNAGMYQCCFYDYYFEGRPSKLVFCNALFSSQMV